MRATEFLNENKIIVYHGNQGGIHRELITPMWWTTEKQDAVKYATQNDGDGTVYRAELTCKKPYVVKPNEETNQVVNHYKELIERGYDCVYDPGVGDYIPLNSKNIKILDKEKVGEMRVVS